MNGHRNHVDRKFRNTILVIMIPSTLVALNSTEYNKCNRTCINVFVIPFITTGGGNDMKG